MLGQGRCLDKGGAGVGTPSFDSRHAGRAIASWSLNRRPFLGWVRGRKTRKKKVVCLQSASISIEPLNRGQGSSHVGKGDDEWRPHAAPEAMTTNHVCRGSIWTASTCGSLVTTEGHAVCPKARVVKNCPSTFHVPLLYCTRPPAVLSGLAGGGGRLVQQQPPSSPPTVAWR